MPVSQDHRLLFVHIPKTGGTSVEEFLGMRGPWEYENKDTCFGFIQSRSLLRRRYGSNFLQHLTISELCDFLGDELLGLTPFAVLRDPWSRLLSSYRRKDPDLCSLFHYKCHHDLNQLTLGDYVELSSWLDHPHLRPQWKFLNLSSGCTPDPRIRLFRQERMPDLESWLSKYLGANVRFSRSNVHVPLTSLPDMQPEEIQSLKSRVNEIYAQDLDLLNRCCPLETPGFPGP